MAGSRKKKVVVPVDSQPSATSESPLMVKLSDVNIIMTVPKGFRAYEISTAKMLYEEELIERGVWLNAKGKINTDGLIPLWNTGQRDQQHKQIYEGDICEIEIDTGMGGVIQRIGCMRWSLQHNNFSLHFNGRSMFSGGVRISACRVIGNEFQDKEASKRYHDDNNK